jgi:hypothetical protein
MEDTQVTEDIPELCSQLLNAAGIDHILLVDPTPEVRQVLEWVWRRMIDGKTPHLSIGFD